jgi:hypothetical protein
MTSQFNSLLQVLDYFIEEKTCIAYLAQTRWADAPSCPHCGNVGAYITNRGYMCKAKNVARSLPLLLVQYSRTLKYLYVDGLPQCTYVPPIKRDFFFTVVKGFKYYSKKLHGLLYTVYVKC